VRKGGLLKRIWSTGALLAAALAIAAPLDAAAQAYPNHAVTLVVPFATGGPTDLSGRLVAKVLSQHLGVPVVVENRPGVGGSLGATQVSKAAPDGYTLLWGSASTLAVGPAVMPNIQYDAVKSFEHISLIARQPHFLVGQPGLAKDLKGLVALAKSKPGKLSYGSAGNGSVTHLTAEHFKSVFGVDVLHVPYKGGGPALNDLLGGQIQMVFDSASILLPHIQAGKLRAFAVTGKRRDPVLPDVPTVAEALGTEFEAYSFFGLVAPKGTPASATNRLAAELRKVVADEEVRQTMTKLGFEVMGTDPEEFRRFITEEVGKWSKVAKEKSISVK
jgi:tripartite-type tricarboxylate transporter receptor subunit TctC